jgi:pimeloyl-ACP methyl ester carboxylesterase
MSRTPVSDVIVLLPGITGSVLQKDGRDIWALSGGAAVRALTSLGSSIKGLKLDDDNPAADDLGDGIVATRVIADTHLIPGLWKIDGYGRIAKTIRDEFDIQPGVNFFEFPYDWRRDNRVHARRLARESWDWLKQWRERSGNDDAKLVLIAHSMGGLICRHFLEVLDGWKNTRLLLTFGTPYRGSLNALDFIVNGDEKKARASHAAQPQRPGALVYGGVPAPPDLPLCRSRRRHAGPSYRGRHHPRTQP